MYKGYWKDDQPHGEGEYSYRNGDMYQGMHDDGDFHGTGKFISHDGTVYYGQWKRGRRDGKGQYYDTKAGTMTEGEWREDVFEKYEKHHSLIEGCAGEPLKEGFSWKQGR